jgi:hypothetical protein
MNILTLQPGITARGKQGDAAMTEQDRTPGTADDDTTGHGGRGYPGDIEREDEDDTTGHGRGYPEDGEHEDDNDPDDDTIGHGRYHP